MVFDDRHDAGRQLAPALTCFARDAPVVFAVPPGGIPVATEVAAVLNAPLDTVLVCKLGAPQNPERVLGAIAENGIVVIDQSVVRDLGVAPLKLREIVAEKSEEFAAKLSRARESAPSHDVRGRTAIVVDDGLTTGLSGLAAVRALRSRGAEQIVVAVPVGSRQAISLLEKEADRVVCITTPLRLNGVSTWYDNFSPVPDEDALTDVALFRAGLRPLLSPDSRRLPRQQRLRD